jgi:diguanylate cyclase (GGDEF)-like protein/PAS domain S-box-containing protein
MHKQNRSRSSAGIETNKSISARPPKRRDPIRLLVVCGIFLIAAIATGTAIMISNTRDRALESSERELDNAVLLLARHFDQHLEDFVSVQNELASQVRLAGTTSPDDFKREMSTYQMHLKMTAKVSGSSDVAGVNVYDADGTLINSSEVWPIPGLNIADRAYFNDLKSGSLAMPYQIELVRSRMSGGLAAIIARKMTGPNGEFLGIITRRFVPTEFEDFFSSVVLGKDSAISMFHHNGMMLARYPHVDEIVGRNYRTGSAALINLFDSDHGKLRLMSPVDAQERLVSVQRLSRFPLTVLATTTVASALANWRAQTTFVIAAAILSALVIVVILSLIVRQLSRQHRSSRERLALEKLRLDTAVNNMNQGLLLFDSSNRIVVCNQRYIEIYGLSPDVVKPGCSFRDLIAHLNEVGSLQGDIDEHCSRMLGHVSLSESVIINLASNGRSIQVTHRLVSDGGWVATHEDITERVKREASFRLLFDNNPVPMWVFDQHSLDFIAVNQTAVDKYGYTREKFLSLKLTDIRPPEARERLKAWVGNIQRTEDAENVWQHLAADGRVMDVCIYSQAMNYEGHDARLVAIHDVTDQKHAAEQLAKTKKFLDAVIENVPVPIVVKDIPKPGADAESFTFSLINKAAEELYGVSRAECIGKTLSEIFPEEKIQFLFSLDNQALLTDGAVISEDHTAFSHSKGVRLVTSRRMTIRGTSGRPEHLVALFEDVTDRREAEKRIEFMAHHDVLTGLANRAAFDECFTATLKQAALTRSRVSLMCLDLDGFKEINDTYGHSAGDAVLQEIAKKMTLCAEGAFIARFGGDEFAMILPDDEGLSCANLVAHRLLSTMNAELPIAGHRLKVGITIGVAQYPQHGTDCETLLSNADVALYRAKATEPGTVQFFVPQMGMQVRERRALQDDLRHALAEGELTLHYQPQFAADDKVIGFEALARWHSPKRGSVSPAIFIEAAEDSNLILALGEWALREACREASTWATPYKVSVNISPKQFRHGDLPSLVHSILIETGLRPARLELEITEGILIDDFSRALSVLNRLKALGVVIALDDFGTGYSSLSYLHSFPFDLIKIDRTFVSDLLTNRHSMAIIRAVIGLGRSLGVPVLAEGVETKQQCDFLFEVGCSAIQGYLTGKPLPAESYRHLLFAASEIETRLESVGRISAA